MRLITATAAITRLTGKHSFKNENIHGTRRDGTGTLLFLPILSALSYTYISSFVASRAIHYVGMLHTAYDIKLKIYLLNS